jgi:ABC-type transporter Mla subunit MlaD
MKFKFKHTEKLVGVFVIIAFIILAAGVVMIAVSQKAFVKTYRFRTLLSDAAGLSISTPLNFKGYKIGKVSHFSLNRENYIDVEFQVYYEFLPKIVPGSVISRLNNPITGKTTLVLLPPKRTGETPPWDKGTEGEPPLPEGSLIPSLDTEKGRKLLEEHKVDRSGDPIAILFDDAGIFFSNLRKEFKFGKDEVRTFIKNLTDVSESLARNREVFDNLYRLLEPEKGPVFNMIERYTETTKHMEKALDQLTRLAENYQDPDGLMLKMFQLEKNRLDETIQNLNDNLAALRKMLRSLEEQSPLVAEVLEKTRKTLEAVNNNPLLRGGIRDEGPNTNKSRKKRLDIDQ